MTSKIRIVKHKINVFITIGEIFRFIGKWGEAESILRKALRLSEKNNLKKQIGIINKNLGVLCEEKGEYQDAMFFLEKAKKTFEHTKDTLALAHVIGVIGLVYYYQEEIEKAEICFKRQIQVCEEWGDYKGLSIAMHNLGNIYFDKGDYYSAMKYYKRELEIEEKNNSKHGFAIGSCSIGSLYLEIGEYEKAMEYYRQSIDLLELSGDQFWIGYVSYLLGRLYKNMNFFDMSLKHYDKAITIARELETKFWLAEYLVEKAHVLVLLNRYEEAKSINKEGLYFARLMGYKSYEFFGKIIGVHIDFANGDEKSLKQLYEMIEETQDEREKAPLYYELWKLETGEKKEKHRQKALYIYQKLYEKIPNIEYKNRIKELMS